MNAFTPREGPPPQKKKGVGKSSEHPVDRIWERTLDPERCLEKEMGSRKKKNFLAEEAPRWFCWAGVGGKGKTRKKGGGVKKLAGLTTLPTHVPVFEFRVGGAVGKLKKKGIKEREESGGSPPTLPESRSVCQNFRLKKNKGQRGVQGSRELDHGTKERADRKEETNRTSRNSSQDQNGNGWE